MMKALELTAKERVEFQFMLPAQGSLDTLELVSSILNKVKITTAQEMNSIDAVPIEFEDEEINLMKESINAFSEAHCLRLTSLELAKKILRS